MTDLSFALRRRAMPVVVLAVAALLVACGDTSAAPGTDPDPGRTAAVSGGVVEVSSDNLAFDVDVIEAPAGEDFTIRLTNLENIPHNLSVYTERGGTLIALGAVITQDQTDEIEIPALEAGEYFFVCDLHVSEMNGTLVVEG